MAARPLVLPDPFSGESPWDEWICHFENVAAVNEWNDDAKLLWLKVRLTGKAQKAFQRFPEDARASYEESRKLLKGRFEPETRRERYRAEFQICRKKKEETWIDFADNLKILVDKAYPELDEAAREQLALNHYLTQIADQQIAFSVKQKRPKTLDEESANHGRNDRWCFQC
jgi:dsDNA-binding SOS-regulon protein